MGRRKREKNREEEVVERELVVIDIGRHEYVASVNLNPTLTLRDEARAAVDVEMDLVVWFGSEAHSAVSRDPREHLAIWPFEKPLECNYYHLVEAFYLMFKRIPLQNRSISPTVAFVYTEKFSNEEMRIMRSAVMDAGFNAVGSVSISDDEKKRIFGENGITDDSKG